MSTYEIWRINPATKKLISRVTRRRVDAARFAAVRMLAQMDISAERAQFVTARAIERWDGSIELVALVGDTELHMFRG